MDFASLTAADRDALLRAVEAVAKRDLDEVGRRLPSNSPAHSAREFFTWADQYGAYGRVTLLKPPGPMSDWDLVVLPLGDHRYGGRPAFEVAIDMWTEQEGRSDLTLRVDLIRENDGSSTVFLHDLHVL